MTIEENIFGIKILPPGNIPNAGATKYGDPKGQAHMPPSTKIKCHCPCHKTQDKSTFPLAAMMV